MNERRQHDQIRLTMAAELGGPVDGAWWPYTTSVAQELPGLIVAVKEALGDIVDIGVNWSSLAGVPDLDSFNLRGTAVVLGREARHQRVMTLTGSRAKARLLVVPCGTSTAVAVMLLRRAARLPIMSTHMETEAFRIADGIVRAACAEEQANAASPTGSA